MASHSLGIIPLSLSKLLERFAYYGMRSILILYMINQLALEQHQATSIYKIFILAVGILPILGGLIGDLLLSTKNTALIGGFIQALGFFVLALPSQTGVYLGLLLIALGAGLYSPNILSTINSIYKNKLEKLDAAMLILYLSINIGAFLGSYLLALTSDYLGYNIGFIVCGIIMIGAQLILLLSNNLLKEAATKPNINEDDIEKKRNSITHVLIVISTILFISIFWTIYEISNNPIFDRLSEIEDFFRSFYSTFYAVSTFALIFVGIILIIIYSFVKMSSLLKISIGFIIYAISCAIIGVSCQREISNSYMVLILSAVFLQSVAELFISPIALSAICKYGSRKFNSTLLGAHQALSTLFTFFTSSILVYSHNSSTIITMLISIGLLIVFAVTFLVFYIVSRQDEITS